MTTTSTLTRLAPTEIELEIPISPDELAAAQERAFRKLSKNVRLRGFRPGKVPRKVFEQTYGREGIESQALEDVVPELFAKAMREHDLQAADRPRMEMLPADDGHPDARVKATVAVRPEIELRDYDGVEIEAVDETVSDEDVERSLQALARDRATLVPVERPARLGDVVRIDFEGRIDGEPFEGGSAVGQEAELDENRFIPGFAAGIAGMSAGEKRDVEARFPDDYANAALAGKTAIFAVALHDVKEYELPALDDAFAQSISSHATLDELRADLRRRLETLAAARARRRRGNLVMERLLATHEFPLPQPMIEREIEHLLEDVESDAARAEMPLPAYLEAGGKTEEGLRGELREQAEQRVKGTLLIEAIAKAEGVVATPADVQAELELLARQYGQPVDRIRATLGRNLVALMDGIVRTKTIDLLVDRAKSRKSDSETAGNGTELVQSESPVRQTKARDRR